MIASAQDADRRMTTLEAPDSLNWTRPFHGIQHSDKDDRGRYCSVQDYNSFAKLIMHFEGCGFSPNESKHKSAEAAREAGAIWFAGLMASPDRAPEKESDKPAVTWTKPFHGVQHTKKDARGAWCTVNDYTSFAILKMWYPGCGFSPNHTTHDNVEIARAEGERWLDTYDA